MSVPRPPAGPPPADLIGARPPFAGTSASAPVASPPTAAPSSRAASELAVAQAAMDAYAEPSLYPAGRFTLVKQIGKGAYGAVYFAHEKLPNGGPPRKVAIKHIVNAFVTPMDARRIYREIKVQAHFSPPHPNILPLLEVIKPRDALAFTHIYLVSELMETDLHRVVHSRQDLTSDHISYFVYQTLCALKHIHSAGILHRDLKPSNLLVNADCTLKMCDFGLARESDSSLSQAFTEYVVTRWYRAPEVLLSGGRYTTSIDVWAVGCILGELLLRRPLFPGENYLHQLQLITEILGSPSEEDLDFVRAPPARAFMLRLPHADGVPFAELFPHVRGPCLDLLRSMLTFHPSKRITVEDALQHPFLARVRTARRGVNEDAVPPPRPFRLRVTGGSSALKTMSVDAIKARFYGELCGLSMSPTPSSPPPGHGGFSFGALQPQAAAALSAAAAAAAGVGGADAKTARPMPPAVGGGSLPPAMGSARGSMMMPPAAGPRGNMMMMPPPAGGAGALLSPPRPAAAMLLPPQQLHPHGGSSIAGRYTGASATGAAAAAAAPPHGAAASHGSGSGRNSSVASEAGDEEEEDASIGAAAAAAAAEDDRNPFAEGDDEEEEEGDSGVEDDDDEEGGGGLGHHHHHQHVAAVASATVRPTVGMFAPPTRDTMSERASQFVAAYSSPPRVAAGAGGGGSSSSSSSSPPPKAALPAGVSSSATPPHHRGPQASVANATAGIGHLSLGAARGGGKS